MPKIADDTVIVAPQPAKIPITELFSKTYLRRTITVSAMWATWNFSYFGILLWLPTILTQYKGLPSERVYPFMMAFLTAGIAGRIVASNLTDLIGRKAVLGTSGVCAAVCAFFFGLQTEFYGLMLFGLPLAFFHDGAGCIGPYNGELYPTRIRTTALGWGSGIGRIGSSLAPVTVGFLIAHSQLAVFGLFAACYFIYGLVMFFFGVETKGLLLDEAALDTPTPIPATV